MERNNLLQSASAIVDGDDDDDDFFFFFFFKDLQLYLPIIDNKVLLLHQLREILASSIELFKEDPHFQIANKYSYNQWRIYKLILLS